MRSMPVTLVPFLLMALLAVACPMQIGALPAADDDRNTAMHEKMPHGRMMATDHEEKNAPCEQCVDHAGEQEKLLTSAGVTEKFAPAVPTALLPAAFAQIAQGSIVKQRVPATGASPETALLQTIVLRV
ncbi:MAG: hypothetical protein AAB853_03970 [Patescibacteria group bacterium]